MTDIIITSESNRGQRKHKMDTICHHKLAPKIHLHHKVRPKTKYQNKDDISVITIEFKLSLNIAGSP